ncbi:MAG: deoxyribonuclease IV [Phycisphaeraceae bacterium]|nr:deoxyribonuclease IV [Phycisphaeraceae bacterium]MCB9847099.1 deoxyribonuclease IV [Phycisphaeraceae bacterium]
MLFGSHLSIAGGMVNAINEAEKLGFGTVQVFTKNQRQWAFKPLEEGPTKDWLDGLDRLGWRERTVAHDSYLINLASPKDDLWAKSIDLMREELARCDALSIPYLVSHPGAHTGSGEDAGLDRIAAAYRELFRERPDFRVTLCLEITAGGGSTLGRSFEELADLRQRIIDRAGSEFGNRVGFCFDTCHALAAGYDITTEKKTEKVLQEFDRVCGLANLKVLHLNDSKGALGSHVDRHEHLGMGEVGEGAFACLVNHRKLSGVPMILETPKGENEDGVAWDTVNLGLLRRLVRDDSGGRKRVAASMSR